MSLLDNKLRLANQIKILVKQFEDENKDLQVKKIKVERNISGEIHVNLKIIIL